MKVLLSLGILVASATGTPQHPARARPAIVAGKTAQPSAAYRDHLRRELERQKIAKQRHRIAVGLAPRPAQSPTPIAEENPYATQATVDSLNRVEAAKKRANHERIVRQGIRDRMRP